MEEGHTLSAQTLQVQERTSGFNVDLNYGQ